MAVTLSPIVTPDAEPFDDDDDGTASDTSSVLTEIDQNDFANYFVERDGRLFPSSPLMVYPLPVDGHEQSVGGQLIVRACSSIFFPASKNSTRVAT